MQKTILLVDHDEDIRELLKIVFRDSGYDLIVSADMLDAGQIRLLHPDLVILDVRAKGSVKSGADICAELKSDAAGKPLPVILCSGHHNLAAIARESRADTYLSKPFDTSHLMSTVNKYLS